MHVVKFIVQKKVLVALTVVLILLVGSFAAFKLDKELFPSLTFDGAYVTIYAGDAAAIDVERNITTPLERNIEAIKGVEEIHSTSLIGSSTISIMLERGSDDDVFKEVEAVVNSTTKDMHDITEVEIAQSGTSSNYEFFLDVSDGSMEELTAFSTDVLEPRLEELPEVRDVSLMGLLQHEMVIEVDRDKLQELGLEASAVIDTIQQSNSESTVGEITENETSTSIRWNTKLTSEEDVNAIKFGTATGDVALKDIAKVTFQALDSSSYVWKDGTKDIVFVQVGRAADATQIEMAEAIRAEISKIREEGLVTNVKLNEMVAQADYVSESIDSVTRNILIGGAIAILILLLFFRNIRATVIVGLSIPVSILLTFISMWVLDYSFNILTLIGLGLGVGMMVDSSIVILESIYRKKEQGYRNIDAVIKGTKEVATAVIASMLTTIVVFLPIGMVGGEIGQFMIILALVVAVTLISSVIVSFSLIPTLSDTFLKITNKKYYKQGKIVKGYARIVTWIVKKKRHSLAVIGAFIVVLACSLFLVTKIPMSIMPDIFNRYNELVIEMESGLSIAEKEELVQKINEELSKIQDVETNYVMESNGVMYSMINMTKGANITREQDEINADITRSLRSLQDDYPVVGIQMQTSMNEGGVNSVQVNIEGEDYTVLQDLADNFTNKLSDMDGVVGITNSMERTSVEQEIVLNEEKMDEAGLSQQQMKRYTEQAFMNMPVDELEIDNEVVPLSVKWDQEVITKEDILDLMIPTIDGEEKLATFIELKTVETPNEISHVNGNRFVSIDADIEGTDLGTINRQVEKLLADIDTPVGYTISTTGDLEQQQELMEEMLMVLGIAIFLVYLVMAVQFNHLLSPFIVMSVIPMTFVGVIVGLFLTQQPLNMMSGMGVIMLIGIVLNNAILLIDRIKQLRQEGSTVPNAIVTAGTDRIRPIFMTTLTTAGGMLPLALASGSTGNYQTPMATAIISGLLFATFITLLLIPAVYRLFTRKENIKQTVSSEESTIKVTI